jgi:hypothetical protein
MTVNPADDCMAIIKVHYSAPKIFEHIHIHTRTGYVHKQNQHIHYTHTQLSTTFTYLCDESDCMMNCLLERIN